MMKKTIGFMLLVLTLGCAMAQTFQLRGVVCDKAYREPIPFASILLPQDSSGILYGVSTDPDGIFKVNSLSKGYYCMVIKCVGYPTRCMMVQMESDLDLDTIWLTSPELRLLRSSSDQCDDFDFTELTKSHLAELAKGKDYEGLKERYYQRYLFCRANPLFTHTDSPADSALKYLTLSWKQDKQGNAHLYYPIRQVEHSLGIAHDPCITRPKQDLPYGHLQPSYSAMISDSCWINSSKNLLSPIGSYLDMDSLYHQALSPLGIAPFGPEDGNAVVYDWHHPWYGHELLVFKDGQLFEHNWDHNGTILKSTHTLTPAQCDSIQALLKAIGQKPLADQVNRHYMCTDWPDMRVMTYIDGQQEWIATAGCVAYYDYLNELQTLNDYLNEIAQSYTRKLTINVLNPNVQSQQEVAVQFKIKHIGSDFYFQYHWQHYDTPSLTIPAGKYRLIARAPGHFAQRTTFDVTDSATTVDVKLRPMPFSSAFVAIHNWANTIRSDIAYRRYKRKYGIEE